jgi:hypothetical protein
VWPSVSIGGGGGFDPTFAELDALKAVRSDRPKAKTRASALGFSSARQRDRAVRGARFGGRFSLAPTPGFY